MRDLLRPLLPLCLCAALACGGGGSGSGGNATPPAPPYSPPWAETPADPDAPPVPGPWRSWVEQHHLPLASLDPADADTSDLMPWAASLTGKRVVFLGESSHGTGEFSAVKVRAIRFLHEQAGFDVMVFESPLFALHAKDRTAATEDPVHLMQNSIYGVWNTEETAELFRYIRATRATPHPLILAGMDIQTSAPADAGLQAFVDTQLAGQDPAKIADADSAISRSQAIMDLPEAQSNAALVAEGPGLSSRLDALAAWMDTLMPGLVAAAADPRDPLIARQSLWSRARLLEELAAYAVEDRALSSSTRDAGMGQNLIYLADKVYPGKKLMVWCHNVHAQNHGDDPKLYLGFWSGFPSAGTVAKAHFGNAMYTLGLFMYRGASNGNTGVPISVLRVSPSGLEAVLYCTRRRAALVELNGAAGDSGAAWMRDFIPDLYWGYSPEHMVPQAQYDAILFVDTTHPSVYLPWLPAAAGRRPSMGGSLGRLADAAR